MRTSTRGMICDEVRGSRSGPLINSPPEVYDADIKKNLMNSMRREAGVHFKVNKYGIRILGVLESLHVSEYSFPTASLKLSWAQTT